VVLAKLLCTERNNFDTEVDWYRTGRDSTLIHVSTWLLHRENVRKSLWLHGVGAEMIPCNYWAVQDLQQQQH